MNLAAYIARRFFLHSKTGVSGVVLNISILSVAIGLAVMIAAISIVIGFKYQIRDKVIGFVSHIQVESLDNNSSYEVNPITFDSSLISRLNTVTGVKHIQGTASKAGIIKTDDHIQGIVLKGVGTDFDWNYMQARILDGRKLLLIDTSRSDEVLVSSNLSKKLFLKTGDDLRVWFIGSDKNQPRGRKFIVVGIYETGLTEFDQMHIFGDIQQVQRLNQWSDNQVGAIEVNLYDLHDLNQAADDIDRKLPIDLAAYTVRQNYPHIFDWLDLQDMNVIVIILLMVMVAGMTMISTLLIIILERTSLIGILKAMGANNLLIRKIFLIHSMDILTRGLIFGNIIGIGFCLLQAQFGFIKLPAESYYLSEVPIYLTFSNVLFINVGTILVWLLMMLIPTIVISRIVPSRAIRFS
jgi:lipoprotein-releasing system permease protein